MMRKDYTFYIGEKLWEAFKIKVVQENAQVKRDNKKIKDKVKRVKTVSQSSKIRDLIQLYLKGKITLPEVLETNNTILAGIGLDEEYWKELKHREIDAVEKGKVNIAKVLVGLIQWYVNKE